MEKYGGNYGELLAELWRKHAAEDLRDVMDAINCNVSYPPPPLHHRGFYLSKHPQKPQKQHPIPGAILAQLVN
jgi:hypothetical protein